jgi:hypothetical protein
MLPSALERGLALLAVESMEAYESLRTAETAEEQACVERRIKALEIATATLYAMVAMQEALATAQQVNQIQRDHIERLSAELLCTEERLTELQRRGRWLIFGG